MLNDKEKKDMENPTEIPVNEKVIQGAAVAGAIAGFVISGPLVGAAGAIGAGALASQNNKGGGKFVRLLTCMEMNAFCHVSIISHLLLCLSTYTYTYQTTNRRNGQGVGRCSTCGR
mmetsp:Transcript_741/g.1033  ORF Transcript_741/g.1033 Transcript_741/m.1033 type:complete len:116 (+) Transcript_741:110-457(+)